VFHFASRGRRNRRDNRVIWAMLRFAAGGFASGKALLRAAAGLIHNISLENRRLHKLRRGSSRLF